MTSLQLNTRARAAIKMVALAGAAIYLFVFGFAMLMGPFTWHPDWLGQHGEPLLVIGLGAFTLYEALSYLHHL